MPSGDNSLSLPNVMWTRPLESCSVIKVEGNWMAAASEGVCWTAPFKTSGNRPMMFFNEIVNMVPEFCVFLFAEKSSRAVGRGSEEVAGADGLGGSATEAVPVLWPALNSFFNPVSIALSVRSRHGGFR